MTELGCASCHAGLPESGLLRQYTPDLSSAGWRYQPAYLFEFLQHPAKVRRHLGRARMPDYHLSPQEALALTAFLQTQRRVAGHSEPPDWPEPLKERIVAAAGTVDEARAVMAEEGLLCLNCHTLAGQGGVVGLELARVSQRLQPLWVQQFLVAPHLFGVAPETMPAQFFETSGNGFQELQPGAAVKLGRIVQALFSIDARERSQAQASWEAARAAYPQANAGQGEALFRAFNCAACHRIDGIKPRAGAAPDLSRETHRVTAPWLRQYLRRPTPIRPFGFQPGDGGRMPDFHLTEEESAQLAGLLAGQDRQAGDQTQAELEYEPRKLSAFTKRKARLLLAEKLSCLGCHRLGGQGGRIGPDLSLVPGRLQPAYVYRTIKEPKSANPHSIMPRSPLDEKTARLIADYLLGLEPGGFGGPAAYLSPLDHPLIPWPILQPEEAPVQARQNYATYCAPCHGNGGQGDGFNASFLPVRPAVHANRAHMATRPDDSLYDGIYAGGYILNQSHLMPAWGGTLSSREIRDLVQWMRILCDCQGPDWSVR